MQDEISKLVDGVEVDGVRIRPWSLGDLAKLAGAFERVLFGLKTRGVTLDNVAADPSKLLFSVLPEAPMILSVTLRKPLNEVEELTNEKALQYIMAVLQLNMEYLKNSVGPLMTVVKTVATA